MINIFLCFKLIKPKELIAKNHATVGQKADPRQCATISIMGTLIYISSVIGFEKYCTNRTMHTSELIKILESPAKLELWIPSTLTKRWTYNLG